MFIKMRSSWFHKRGAAFMSEEHNALIDVSAKKLTDWKNEPSVQDLKNDLLEANGSHQVQVEKIKRWLDNLHVTGTALVNVPKGQSRVQPKLIRKQAEWRYAAMSEPFLSSRDIFKVSPVTWEDREAAQQNQLLLNHQFNTKLKKVAFIDEYVRAAVDEGTAIIRTGWETEEEDVEELQPVVEFTENFELMPMFEELVAFKQENPTGFEHEVPEELRQAVEMFEAEGIPYEARIIDWQEVTVTKTLKNDPTLELCDPDNVVIDPTCMGDMNKAGFVVYRFASSLSQLEKDGRYTNLKHINLQTNNILGEPDNGPDNSSDFNFRDKPRQKFTVHEYWGYWDIDGSGLVKPIVAAWVGDVLIRLEENPFPDKRPPFVAVPYLPVRKSLYGEPDGALLEDNQRIIGAVTRGMIDLMGKSANGQTGIRKDALDVTNKRKFEKGQDYEFNANVSPDQVIYTHKYPEIPNSAQFMLQLQNVEAESLTGVKAFNQGISGDTLGKTATGARGALDAASKREVGILRRLSAGLLEVGRKLIAMNKEFLSDEEIIRITNDSFVAIRRDDLAGNFDLELTISTAEEDNQKAEELAFILQATGDTMDPVLKKMILSDIMRLRKMPDLAKRVEEYEPEPDPIQQKLQELEIAKLESEIALNQAKAQQLGADAMQKGAKAENIQADTDQKSLDFVEQESGVKQERDLEKVGEQARSQMGLKAMDIQAQREKDRREMIRSYVESSAT
jgi:hypothetical protein